MFELSKSANIIYVHIGKNKTKMKFPRIPHAQGSLGILLRLVDNFKNPQ